MKLIENFKLINSINEDSPAYVFESIALFPATLIISLGMTQFISKASEGKS